MKRLLVLGTIAAVALCTNVQAQPHRNRTTARQFTTTRQATQGSTTTVAPTQQRTVVRNYSGGTPYYSGGTRYYSGGTRYYSGSPYYSSGPNVSIGVGTGFGYPSYGYGYGSPYTYGYGYNGYPYYGDYPYSGGTTYTTTYVNDGSNMVAAVQRRLARYGYYHGVIDGVMGPQTAAAVAQWEARHGMVADGRIDRRVLNSLGIG